MTIGPLLNSNWCKRIAAVLFCLLGSVGGPMTWAAADDTAGAIESRAWDLAQLMRELGQVSQAYTRFTEEKYSSLLEEPLILTGTLHYSAPTRVEKDIRSPFKERYVVEGDTLLIENSEGERTLSLRKYPMVWGLVESFRATLSGNLATLQSFYETRLYGDRNNWRLELVPRDEDLSASLESIHIEGSGKHITRIDIREVGGDHSRMRIHPDPS